MNELPNLNALVDDVIKEFKQQIDKPIKSQKQEIIFYQLDNNISDLRRQLKIISKDIDALHQQLMEVMFNGKRYDKR